MKSVLLLPAVAAVLCAASPALACRIPSEAARTEAATPKVGVIATVEARAQTSGPDGVETASVTLSVSRVLEGEAPARISLSAPVTDIVITTCGPLRLEGRDLLALPVGAQVVATGIQPDSAAPDIRQIALLDSAQGRLLLERLERDRVER
ncbi:hypothetical protein [Brevundimonas sp.]|uniref:hypothetical protein n=1 Tax=Brevundimonas sp. TaxID=1871086 RepID=UPI002ED7D8C1